MTEENRLEGLGGLLMLVGLGIVFSPILMIVQTYPVYSEMFSNGSWEVLTTPGSRAYNPFWAPILICEITINIALFITWLFVAFLFFSKKKIFPRVYIGVLLFTLVFLLVDAFSIKLVLPNEPVFDPDTSKNIIRSLVVTLVWVPYMFMSKRVKATFVK